MSGLVQSYWPLRVFSFLNLSPSVPSTPSRGNEGGCECCLVMAPQTWGRVTQTQTEGAVSDSKAVWVKKAPDGCWTWTAAVCLSCVSAA